MLLYFTCPEGSGRLIWLYFMCPGGSGISFCRTLRVRKVLGGSEKDNQATTIVFYMFGRLREARSDVLYVSGSSIRR